MFGKFTNVNYFKYLIVLSYKRTFYKEDNQRLYTGIDWIRLEEFDRTGTSTALDFAVALEIVD